MKAILRRTSGAEKEAPQLVTVGKNQVNLRIGKVYCGNEEVLLTAMEYRLLLIFRGITGGRSFPGGRSWIRSGTVRENL